MLTRFRILDGVELASLSQVEEYFPQNFGILFILVSISHGISSTLRFVLFLGILCGISRTFRFVLDFFYHEGIGIGIGMVSYTPLGRLDYSRRKPA